MPIDDVDALIESCTDVAGNDLRSLVVFTTDEYDQIFLRDYLSAEADIERFVENERPGFDRTPTHEGSELGSYRYTIRRFEHGYLVRVVAGDLGVFATTNRLDLETFDELASAIEGGLQRVTA